MEKRINTYLIRTKSVRAVIWIIRLLFIIGLCYLFLFPIFYLLVVGLQDPGLARDPTIVWIPTKLTLGNFKLAFEMMDYQNSSIITYAFTILSTLASMLSCSMVGYGLSRFQFAEKKLAFALVILIIIVPPQTTMISSYLNFRYFDVFGILSLTSPLTGVENVNLLGTIWTFVLPSLFASGLRSGLFIFLFRQFFSGLPKELEEAAHIDGCNALRTYVRVIIPLAVPAFITVALFSFVWHWNEIYTTTMYFVGQVKPLAVSLNSIHQVFLRDQANGNQIYSATQMRGSLAAGALLAILPPLILYTFTQKYFTESMERSGIVG